MGQGSSCSAEISEKELQLLRDTMKLVQKDEEEIGVTILARFLERYNYYSYFKKFAGIPASELRNNAAFRAHSLKVIKTLAAAVSEMDQFSHLETELIKLGKRHASRKLTQQQFLELKSVIFECLDERFHLTPEMVEAWKKAFDIGYELIFKGLNSDAR